MASKFVGDRDEADAIAKAMSKPVQGTKSAKKDKGKWITVHGARVHVDENGKIDKGPKVLMGKKAHGDEDSFASHTKNLGTETKPKLPFVGKSPFTGTAEG